MKASVPLVRRHEVVIVGGGTVGITVAARLRHAGVTDVAVLEPSERHYYQPLWTLVGAGLARPERTVRGEAGVIPKGVTWIRQAAAAVDPQTATVTLTDGSALEYGFLVMAPGLQLNFDTVPGLTEALGRDGVCSNYRLDLAPATWNFIRQTRSGTALFTMPPGPVKCAGASQKIAYLAADWWRRQCVLADMRVILALPAAAMFSQPAWGEVLRGIAAGYGIEVRHDTRLVEVDGPRPSRRLAGRHHRHQGDPRGLDDARRATAERPDWVKASPLADPDSPFGYVEVDQYTQSRRWPNVFALGDVVNLPTYKTGAAIRKQAPVVVTNLLAARRGASPRARYDGYTSCPLVTAHNRMMLAEFDYTLMRPSDPATQLPVDRHHAAPL